jgi:hypothetical protein
MLCINQIRTVLGDNADHPIYIETRPRRGYRFIAPVVSKVSPAPRPNVIESDFGKRSRFPVLIGSGTGAATAKVAPDRRLRPIREWRQRRRPRLQLLRRHDVDSPGRPAEPPMRQVPPTPANQPAMPAKVPPFRVFQFHRAVF